MSICSYCTKGFAWDGTPTGRIGKLADNDTYIAGSNPDVAVLLVHDLFGWTFPNNRLLADHYAKEADVTVYVPDFYAGEVVPFEAALNNQFDIQGFLAHHTREVREPEIFACARALRQKYKKVAAIGFCWGGWACLRLGAGENQPPLVDCISVAHPSMTVKQDIDQVAVPVQMLAPAIDPAYTMELKLHTFETLMAHGVPFDYQHFPGITHGGLARGDQRKDGEREAMVRAKDAAVAWFRQWLH